MNPDFFNLSGLEEAKPTEQEATQEEPMSMAEQLTELYEEIANMLNNEYSSIDAVEVRWFCGERIRKVLGALQNSTDGPKALKQIIKKVSAMTKGKIDQEKALEALRLAETFPDMQIISRLSEKLSLEQITRISELEDDMQRIYYSEKAFSEEWTQAQLEKAISDQVFEKEDF